MQAQTHRQLLRNIGCNILYKYLMPVSQRIRLGYIQQCCQPVHNPQQYVNMGECCVGLDCEMVETNIGLQLCRIVVVRLDQVVLFDRWFDIKQGTHIIDFVTHVTGINEEIYQQKMSGKPHFDHASRDALLDIIKDKVVVGHDLSNDLRLLSISHQAFLDSVWLMPHHFGLPLKNKLKDITLEYLKKYIQWGNHDPFEDALSSLQVIEKHITDGRGTIEIEEFPEKQYNNDYLMVMQDAELDIGKVLMLVLRGSRALGIHLELEYKSDWDYIVVYDTQSLLDGRLIKLPNVDITFFDKNSFRRHMENNDISYLEAFFLPAECVYMNKIAFPPIQLSKLRASLGFHINKTKMKIKRFQKEQGQNKLYYEWKILKTQHLAIRFQDLFQQLFDFHTELQKERQAIQKQGTSFSESDLSISDQLELQNKSSIDEEQDIKQVKIKLLANINIKRMNQLWYQVEKQFRLNRNFEQMSTKLQMVQTQKQKIIHQLYSAARRLGHRDQPSNLKIQKYHDQHSKHMNNVDSKQTFPVPKSELDTINFLRVNPVECLQKYNVLWKRHKIYNNLIQLHYHQSANFNTKIPRECRGLILDESENFNIVAYPYDKFFDYNDPKCSQLSQIDWESAKVYEKKDGSLAFLYYYADRWHVASSTVPDGQNSYCFAKRETTTEFRNEFWSIFYALEFKLPAIEDRTKTFVFEMMSKNHIIVVRREKSSLCLHGVRDIKTLKQQDHIPFGSKYNWNVSVPIQVPADQMKIECLVKRVENLDPLKCQGFVVCDKNWIRLKIKNSSYVRINWLGELNLGFKDPKKFILIEIILSGEAETFCKYCPEWEKVVMQFVDKIKRLNTQVSQIFETIKHLQKRQYAERIKGMDRNIQTFLFSLKMNPEMYKGRVETVMSPKNFYAFILNYK